MLMTIAVVSIICFEASAQSTSAHVSGRVAATYDGMVSVQYADSKLQRSSLDAHCHGGRFEVNVPVEGVAEVVVCAGNEVLARVLVAPEQNLHIEYVDGEPRFTGTAGEINQRLNNYLKKMNFRGFTPSYKVATAEEFVAILDRNIEIERKRMLRELDDAPQLLRQWAEAEIRYRNAGYATEYLRRNTLTDSVSVATLYDRERFPLDSSAIFCLDYVDYVANMVRDCYLSDSHTMGLRFQRDYAGAYVAALERVVELGSSPAERDVAGTILLNMALADRVLPSVLEQIFDRQLIGDEVLARFDAKRRGRADMRRFTEHTFERLLAESHSKVIYVDVWATWCPPCLREMKHLRRMEKRLENEPIKFVSLCVSSPYPQWALTVDVPDNRSANYWLDDEAQATLDRYIRVRSFPRFFVLSGGQIVNDNVQWPSSNDLIDGILRGYIKELKR